MQQAATLPAQAGAALDPLGASSIPERVGMILSLTSDLSDILKVETALIESHQAGKLRDTEEEKTRLSSLYAREMRAIHARPELLKGMTEAQTQDLRTTATDFAQALREHARALSRSRAVTEGLVKAIGEEVGRLRQPVTRYAAPGVSPKPMTPQSVPAALSLDRSI